MHEKFHDLLEQYIDGELEPVEALILEEHLAGCLSCRQMLNQLKLIDWDLKHQPVVEVPPELEVYRIAAVKAYLATLKTAYKSGPLKDTWRLQKQIFQHSFGFVSYIPINRTISSSAKKGVAILAGAARRRLRKRSLLLSRIIPGQA
jgi:anti-sigma factor RsiW